jgi:hypothetical protein
MRKLSKTLLTPSFLQNDNAVDGGIEAPKCAGFPESG